MITKWQLIAAFAERRNLIVGGVVFDSIEGIEHEDGSGHSFLVHGYSGGVIKTVYVQTAD